MRKAFDRIKYGPLFVALRDQEVFESYIKLLSVLYEKQQGYLNGCFLFSIGRGVKQGDVLSPMFPNAGLEAVVRVWRRNLHNHVFLLSDASTRLSNVRYVDDVMFFRGNITRSNTNG